MKTICRIVAGSRLYGLDTPESDTDARGVFLNTDPGEILGLSRRDNFKVEGEDTLLLEFRHYMGHLRKSNTSSIELLFAEGFEVLTPEFNKVRENRLEFIDSGRLFTSLLGYIEGERRLANGERTGHLGSKRKAQIDKYGFSPKNFSHLLRLANCGEVFFRDTRYPVDIRGEPFFGLVFSVKTEPWRYSKESLNLMSDEAVGRLKAAHENRKDDLEFNVGLANRLCLEFYRPFLQGDPHS